ncbi:sigma 54-interacting transcriptional regulator [Ligilactobacillus sp. WILCCON 0076]|uniref:Sigma 54-interacting transcriptional regulator n=1 Tax=Ligilactobacillus ubinensis TaxID=2876789 RepID=A0A9X2JM11_9LACO|nr:sigma-54-dependent transcriptional regulator [Ligilactobacillus ubinensis]MCP0887429.1 sigma 54-interacting transcriptional regulator [Ligilactobacillus ubinensis]
MKRIERIYQYLFQTWKNKSQAEMLKTQGTTTTAIASALKLARTNVSSDLNKLVRTERVLKVKSFPIRYLPVECVLKKLKVQQLLYFEVANLEELVTDSTEKRVVATNAIRSVKEKIDPLTEMIGYSGSLKKATTQAKAAIMYPPHGLHMMLVGQTGVGKTYFANRIFAYAQYRGVFSNQVPFISFNCADYYNNPQLLLATLFGYAKGAFTGATSDQSGLVEQADGGVLLLDEVHRLPPEGQEMLFYFIDNGIFKRLGESKKQRKANVLIICATTEDPSSTLLKTFLRRIPMTIEIPPLAERPLSEKIELAKFLFTKEAQRIKKDLSVRIDVFTALLIDESYGNVGELKSQIQLTCAQAFLNNISSKKVTVILNDLPENLRQVWLNNAARTRHEAEFSRYLDTNTLFYVGKTPQDDDKDNIYELIENKVRHLQRQGISVEDIHQYIMTDIHLHIKNFFKQSLPDVNLNKFVDRKVSKFVEHLKKIAEQELKVQLDQRFIYYLSMHIDAFFKRGNHTDILLKNEVEKIKNTHHAEYQVALIFQQQIISTFSVKVPDIEVIYLTMLLSSIRTLSEKKQVGVLVVAHGNSTASSMVKVATDLLGNANIGALDMPLTVSPNEILRQMAEMIAKLNQGKGVLLLVDMGSLGMMTQQLRKLTGVKLKTLANVTTAVVLDVLRKISYVDMDLDSIYNSVQQDLAQLVNNQVRTAKGTKVILSICMSGSGTAQRLKKIIQKIIAQIVSEEVIEVKTVSILKMTEIIPKIAKEYEIIAAVGTKRPSIAVPYVSLEELIADSGEKRLISIITQQPEPKQLTQEQNIVVTSMCEDVLRKHLVYLNPDVICSLLQNWIQQLQLQLNSDFSNSQQIKCIIHTAFAIERCLRNNPMAYTEEPSAKVQQIMPTVKESLLASITSIEVEITDDELYFISECVLNY